MKKSIILTTALTLLFASDLFAGWVFVSETGGNAGTYVQDNKIKFEAPDQSLTFDVNKNTIVVADTKEKTYWSGTPEEFGKQARKGVESIEKIIAISEKEKQALLGDNKSGEPVEVKVKGPWKSGKISGYATQKYEIFVNGKLRAEKWIAGDIDVGKELDVKRFAEMMRKFQSGFGKDAETAAMWSPKITALLEKGWPLATVDYRSDIDKHVEKTAKVEQKKVSDSVFNPPAGFKNVSFMAIFGK